MPFFSIPCVVQSAMDFSKAVKGAQTPQSLLSSINSRAEVELGRKLLKEEISDLSDKYSLQYVFHTTEKVIIVSLKETLYKLSLVSLV